MIDHSAIEVAANRIASHIRRTPVIELEPGALGIDATLVLKLESQQISGSFKIRGATNAVLSSPELAAGGLVAASGGNHGVAVATVARRMGLRARIFVPSISSEAKRTLLRDLGAEVIVAGDVYVESRSAAQADAEASGGLMVHAFEAEETIIGQGSIGMELDKQAPDLDALVLSVGGGGLAAGLAAWFNRRIPLICAEPERAPTLHAALAAGAPVDVETGGIAADALGCRRLGDLAFETLATAEVESRLVEDEDIQRAQHDLWREVRLAAEPAAALPIACLRAMPPDRIANRRIGVLICGANIDPAQLSAG
ncbi:serine/threonine dehydratase [Nisaea sediminum]|uniref:serine/threonine dehydratase n=1 Tax=Nisaea sediminum TaxID=2775867 RepID=UPI001865DEB1|nr:serine/threonine dehydratase [Nisaea sediminum]